MTDLSPFVLLNEFLTWFDIQEKWLYLNLECHIALVEVLTKLSVLVSKCSLLILWTDELIELLLFGQALLPYHKGYVLAGYGARYSAAELGCEYALVHNNWFERVLAHVLESLLLDFLITQHHILMVLNLKFNLFNSVWLETIWIIQ